MAGIVYDWGGWSFEPAEWRLTNAAGEPVSLPNRTLDLLALLLERAPSLVTKDEILSHVWRESVVEEGNIAFHIATLRKTLDAGESSCIETVRGRGYRFVAAVTRREPVTELASAVAVAVAADPATAAVPEASVLPRRATRRPSWLLLAAVGLTVVIAGVAWFSLKHDAPIIRSVTVLPLPDGLADVVAGRVARDTTLTAVIGSSGPTGEDVIEAGTRLNAEAVLTVAINRSTSPWRVVTEVTRTRDRSRLWSWEFTVNAGTPAVTHADIAARIASGLGRHLSITRADLGPTVNPAAYELFLQAREQWRQRTPHTVQQAITLYERAIALDPAFSRAYAGLADCYNLTMSGLPPTVRYPRALEYAEKAVAIDPNDAAGHTSLAFIRYKFEWRWEEADAEFRRAISLDPDYTLALHWYGEFLGLLGRYDEAIAHLRRASALEPESLAIQSDLIPPLLRAGRTVEARTVVETAAATNPNWPFIPYRMAEVLEAEGREHEAVENRWRWMLLSGSSLQAVDRLRAAYNTGGMGGMTRAEIAGHLESEAATPGAWLNATFLSRLYGRLGERAEALRWLGIAIDRREDAAISMLTNPDYNSLRGDPEFARLMARVGLKK